MAGTEELNLMPLYGVLASLEAEERNAAALTLLKSLAVLQKGHRSFVDNWDVLLAEEDTEERLDKLCHPNVVYALKRLLRGLPSDREAARQGFSLALTELLIGLEFLSASIVLKMLLRFTEIKNFMKGKEERNQMFGRIFGYMSIIQSGLLTRPTTTADDIKTMVDDLVDYSQEKSYLSECCHQVMVSLIPQITEYPESNKYIVVKIFAEGVNTPDQLSVAMALKDHIDTINAQLPKQDQIQWTKLLGRSWKHADIFHVSNLKYLAQLLKETSSEEGAQPSSNWRQRIHPVWDRILDHYFGAAQSTSQSASFQDFWNVVIDASLFDQSSSHERRYWGFQVFERALPLLKDDQLPLVFTTNFMRCFVNNLSSEDRFLNKAAKHTMAAMHAVAEKNEAVRLTLVIQLLDKTPNFDQLSRSKTVETLLGGLDVTHIQQYLQYLRNSFLNHEGSDSDSAERSKQIGLRRQWAIDQMFALFRNSKVPREESWISSILQFYLINAFFEIKRADAKSKYVEAHALPKPELSTATRGYCKARFYSMMAELSTMAPLAPKKAEEGEHANYSRKLNGTMLDGTFWCSYALSMITNLEKNKNFSPIVTLDERASEAKREALALINKIQDKSKKASKDIKAQYKAFELLFVQMVLQLYVEPEDSANILGELHECYNKVFAPPAKKSAGAAKASKKRKNAAEEDDEEEAEEEELQPVEVILDILLSFLIKPSALLRHVSEQVFVIFCDKMTKTGLELLLSTLSTKDNKDDMFGEEGAGEEEHDHDHSDDEDDEENDEENDEEDEDEDEEDDEDEGESEDMEIDEDPEEDVPVDEDLRKRIAEALQMQNGAVGSSSNENSDEEEEELLDDDQMMAFDEKLSEIFKQKKLAKTQERDAKQTLVHFKNKVLDLLELFVKKQSHNELVLELIVPLMSLVLVPSTSNKPVHDKINALLRNKLAKIKDYPRECNEEHVFEILTQVHELAKKAPDAKFSSLCGELSLLLVKVLIGGEDSATILVESKAPAAGKKKGKSKETTANALDANQQRIVSLYIASLQEFMTRKNSNLSAKLFLEFIERFPHLAWHLSATLLDFMSPKAAVKSFRQAKAFDMMAALVKRLANKKNPEFEQLFLNTLPLIQESFQETVERTLAQAQGGEDNESGGKALTVARLREILKFVTTSARMVKNGDRDVQAIWKTLEMGPLLQKLAEDSRFESSGALRSMIQTLLVLMGSDIKLVMKKQEKQEKRKRALEEQQAKEKDGSDKKKKKAHRSKKRKVAKE
ncbi:DNA-directed DNA polymerase [Actinomortierella ambigua]|nr:DNA-directed DNA polymerase [Actinomortierella ambigua]